MSGLAAVLILGIVVLANAGSQSGEMAAHPLRNAASVRVPSGRLRTQTINANLQRAFVIFRHRPAPETARVADVSTFQSLLPKIVSRWLARQNLVLGEASPQNVEVMTADGTEVAVLAGTQGLCMAAATLLPHGIGGYGAVCGPANAVATHGLGFNVQTSAGISRVVGLVPNNNPTVAVTFTSGKTEAVPVISNVFNVSAAGGSPIRGVGFVTAAGAPARIGGAG